MTQEQEDKSLFLDVHLNTLEESELGLNKGIPFRSNLLSKALGGILKGMYYLVVALSNVGKTRFLLDNFLIGPVEYSWNNKDGFQEDDVEVYLWSLEMSLERILAVIASRWMRLFGKTFGYSDRDILGIDGKPSPALLAVLRSEEYKKYLKRLNKNFRFLTAKDIPKIIQTIDKRCKELTEVVGVDAENNPVYKFKNPRKRLIVAIDHVGNVKSSGGKDTDRAAIMNLSIGLVDLKNKYGITPVLLQQANISPDNPMAAGMHMLREAKDTFIDADNVLIIMKPAALNITDVHYNGGVYHVLPTPENGGRAMEGALLIASLVKSRIGDQNPKMPLLFDGAGALIYDAPDPKNIDYSKFKK